MAILKNGLFGPITGKLGNTVIYTVLDKTVLRMKGKRRKPDSIRQLANQQGMAVVNAFLKPLQPFIRVGFGPAAKREGMYAINLAVSHQKKMALKGEYPELEIDYTRVSLAQGSLYGLYNPQLSLEETGLRLSWELSPDQGHPGDQLMLLAYFPVLEEASYILYGAERRAGQEFMELPARLRGAPMEVYCAMVSADRSNVSDSNYLGRIT